MEINNQHPRVCLIPNVSGIGGMVSFRDKLTQGLADRGIGVARDLEDTPYGVILVIGGSRNLAGLRRARRWGIRIVQRLDGMNWIHRVRRTGWRHYLRAEYGNFILSTIRSRLADHIIYQSEFSHQWWERIHGKTSPSWSVVFNGVDLCRYSPEGFGSPPTNHARILIVEGSIGGGYEWGLETAIQVCERVRAKYQRPVELMVVGRISPELEKGFKPREGIQVTFLGQVSPDRIPEIDRSAQVLYAADLNAACPNSVIEALGCGLPVIAFDTGALSELVPPQAGQLAAYGGDPWKLDPPAIDGLADAAQRVITGQADYRKAARLRAEQAFGLDRMVDRYLEALFP